MQKIIISKQLQKYINHFDMQPVSFFNQVGGNTVRKAIPVIQFKGLNTTKQN